MADSGAALNASSGGLQEFIDPLSLFLVVHNMFASHSQGAVAGTALYQNISFFLFGNGKVPTAGGQPGVFVGRGKGAEGRTTDIIIRIHQIDTQLFHGSPDCSFDIGSNRRGITP
jgi:hypothetical protein